MTNSLFLDVPGGLYDAVGHALYNVQLENTRHNPKTEEELLRIFVSQRPAGLIVSGLTSAVFAHDARNGAMLDLQIMELGEDPVDMMGAFPIAMVQEHLFGQGYRAPAFIGARMDPGQSGDSRGSARPSTRPANRPRGARSHRPP